MSLRKFVSHVTKEGHRKKSQCLWITIIVFKWETPAQTLQSITFILLLTLWQTF